ncbi:SGNH/GDSL hydrolase family protein [Nonomuraea sp. NPDC047529]|uniref:SGNH/GDSL hydrolase family protein n=1 Tax=Nonomuraea sp. NPDC047529 TaxID=3155623 RepID=UPI0033F6432C
MIDPMTERLVRFQRPGALPYLIGADEARVAALFGLDADAYRSLLDGFDRQARQAAATLLARPGLADAVDRLPLHAEGADGPRDAFHVVAIGESTTADRLSWFEILGRLVALCRPGDAVRFTNLAITGSTTTQALTQLPALGFQRPDLVLCMIGANDAQHLAPGAPTLVSAAETERNLAMLHDLAQERGPVRWVWLTPSPVDEPRAAAYTHFRRAGISWAAKDLDVTSDHLLGRPELTVDTRLAVSEDHHFLDDGVHLSIEGQREITAAVVRALAGVA